MKDSQQQPKKRMFLKKKENKNAPAKIQQPRRPKVEEKVIYKKEAPKQEVRSKNQEAKFSVAKIFTHISFQNLKKKSSPQLIKKDQTTSKTKGEGIFKQFETDLQLALIPLILLAILSILMLLNNHYIKVIADNKVQRVESVMPLQPFPLAENIIPSDLSAKAAIVVDADSQVILVSKNPELRFSMASTTKIMTALTALDYFDEDAILTVKSYGIEGSALGLTLGEQFVMKDLLYALLLPSANDAAVAIADNHPEGREAFVKKMNEKALLLHLSNTHFADPTGLNDDGNYTTVVDLARLGSYAMKNKTFAEVVGTKQKTIYNTSYSRQYPLTNLNRLLGTNGVNGIKTGTTEGAGEVLVTSTVFNGHTFIIVVMNSEDRFADTRTLLEFVREKVRYIVPQMPNNN